MIDFPALDFCAQWFLTGIVAGLLAQTLYLFTD